MKSLLLLLSLKAVVITVIDLDLPKIEHPSTVVTRFVAHKSALAMNVSYTEVRKARRLIEKVLKTKLDFFKGWALLGEAHITVISPPELEVLKKYISISEINNIARRARIQSSDVKIMGIGSAKNSSSETFFIIVNSENLRKIRFQIYELYVKRSKDYSGFDPNWFFPHITVGFTKRDLHDSDGIYKSVKNTYDKRFLIK